MKRSAYLQETDLAGSFTEALSADVESVLTDDSMTVTANAAKKRYMDEGKHIELHTIDDCQHHSSLGECSTSLSL